jgi:hypothetical protein
MKVTQELIEAFLFQDDEISYLLHRVTGEILLDAPESMTGEPEIDWDDEETDGNLIVIPQISSSEAFEIIVSYTKEQEPVVRDELREILNGRKPFRNFKDKVQIMNLEASWYSFENEYAKNILIEWLEEQGI